MRDSSGRFTKTPKRIASPSQLNAIECDVLTILQTLRALRSEVGERLRVIEGDIEKMQKVIGILAKHSQVPQIPVLPDANLTNTCAAPPPINIQYRKV